MYVASMWGGSLPRPRLVVDTEHESLAELEQYYARFFALAEVQALVPRWAAVVEDTWTENYVPRHPLTGGAKARAVRARTASKSSVIPSFL
jgi:hypothetical protein